MRHSLRRFLADRIRKNGIARVSMSKQEADFKGRRHNKNRLSFREGFHAQGLSVHGSALSPSVRGRGCSGLSEMIAVGARAAALLDVVAMAGGPDELDGAEGVARVEGADVVAAAERLGKGVAEANAEGAMVELFVAMAADDEALAPCWALDADVLLKKDEANGYARHPMTRGPMTMV